MQLEWPTSIPWPNSSIASFSTPSSVTRNKTFHDVNHFGLNKIKKQEIEYLAAVHEKGLNADRETYTDKVKGFGLSLSIRHKAPG